MPETNLKRILAIDYGEKRIGLALSDPLKTFAYPFKTISNTEDLLDKISGLVKEKDVEKIILGIPADEQNISNPLLKKIKNLKEQLEKKIKLEVILWDETYTSAIAKQKIIESVSKKSKRRDKGLLDSNSAAIILQEYLEGAKNG